MSFCKQDGGCKRGLLYHVSVISMNGKDCGTRLTDSRNPILLLLMIYGFSLYMYHIVSNSKDQIKYKTYKVYEIPMLILKFPKGMKSPYLVIAIEALRKSKEI